MSDRGRLLTGRRSATVAIGVLALLAVVLAIQWWTKRPLANDLTTYLNASRGFWSGENPYLVTDPAPFVYPLFLCVALWPLAQLPVWVAGVAWLLGSIAAAALTIYLLARLAGAQRDRLPAAFVSAAIVFVLLADVVQNNIVNGQVNFVVLACCAAFAWQWHRERPVLASVWLAAAIAAKLTPAILLLMLARRGDWKPVVLALAFALLFILVLPWAVAGGDVIEYYRFYIGDFAIGRVTGEAVAGAEQIPFSVAGTLRKFAGVSSPLSATIIGLAVAAVLTLLLDQGRRPGGRTTALTVCLYLAGALLVTPMSEVHHLASLLPGLTLLTWELLERPMTMRPVLLPLVLAAGLLIRDIPGAAFLAVAGTCALLATALRRPSGHHQP